MKQNNQIESGSTNGEKNVIGRFLDFVGSENLSLIIALVLLIFLITVVSGWVGLAGGSKFVTWQNLLNSLAQAVVISGLLALGETVVALGGFMDISIGSIASCGSVAAAGALVGSGAIGSLHIFPQNNVFFSILAGVIIGLIAGLINGLIVTKLHVNAVVATLGTQAAFAGAAFMLAPDGKPIGVVTQQNFTWLAQGRLFQSANVPPLNGSKWTGIPVLTIILLVAVIIMHVVMRYTSFGRAVYAIGGNTTAARLAGINVNSMRIRMFMISGGISGLAGVLLASRTTSGNPINGQGLEMQAMTAVFLGGTSTSGGKGTIFGTTLAVIIVGVLNNGMNLLGFNTFVQKVALGLLLVIAVAISQYRVLRAETAHKSVKK